MDIDLDGKNFLIAKCSVDGHDGDGKSVYGLLLCATEQRNVLYCEALFSHEPIDRDMSLSEAFVFLQAPRYGDDREAMGAYEQSLTDFIRTSRIFQGDRNLNDPKSMEHKVTYFCSANLSLNAVSFLEMQNMTEGELCMTLPGIEKDEKREAAPDGEAAPEDGDAQEKNKAPDIVVACEPVLDPMNGIAVSELVIGTTVYCKLREDSAFYSMMLNASPTFDGIVTGDVTGVSVNELGSATVAVKLSDGVTGAMKAAGTVRVKAFAKQPEPVEAVPIKRPSLEVMLAVGGVIFFLCVMALLLNFFTS